jgi:hypothetical protein
LIKIDFSAIFIVILVITLCPFSASAQSDDAKAPREYDDIIDFSGDIPLIETDYEAAIFHKAVDFNSKIFPEEITFKSAHFYDTARFDNCVFEERTSFHYITFEKKVHFQESEFQKWGRFFGTVFNGEASFHDVEFLDDVYFNKAQFNGICNFTATKFKSKIEFTEAQFHAPVYMRFAEFDSTISFFYAQINAPLRLENAKVDTFIFDGAIIRDKIYIGSSNMGLSPPTADFEMASFTDPEDTYKIGKKTHGGEIVLVGPANILIQIEKFSHISLLDTLDYFTKKNIISTLKSDCFADDDQATERFELDYILARSTKHQDKTSIYGRTKFYQVYKWPHWLATELYDRTMGLGYRPFNLLWWAFGCVILFTIGYAWKMPQRLKEFISLDSKYNSPPEEQTSASKFSLFYENILFAFYFSAAIFFAFRFNKDIFTFFGRREKMWISFEWLLGIIFYVAFFALAQSGSILHRLLGLFV